MCIYCYSIIQLWSSYVYFKTIASSAIWQSSFEQIKLFIEVKNRKRDDRTSRASRINGVPVVSTSTIPLTPFPLIKSRKQLVINRINARLKLLAEKLLILLVQYSIR